MAVVVGALVAGTALIASPGTSLGEEPVLIPWTQLLPGFTSGYDPSSENDCKAGRPQCVDSVIREMDRRVDPLDDRCDHNVMFGLMYLRTTEAYQRSATTAGFFTDPSFINHQDVVFARYYFDAWDAFRRGEPTSEAWKIAFQNADGQKVSGSGNMFLGMSAHVNRDLPQVLASIGLVKPDGSSRKPDHDKVNEFLITVIEPLFDEAAARFDPSVDDAQIDGTTVDETGTINILTGWREQAWRNAERIVAATTEEARAAVIADIERQAAIEANLLVVATSYSSLNVQAALAQLSELGASGGDVLQAEADRAVNKARGLLSSLFTNPATARNSYCATHG